MHISDYMNYEICRDRKGYYAIDRASPTRRVRVHTEDEDSLKRALDEMKDGEYAGYYIIRDTNPPLMTLIASNGERLIRSHIWFTDDDKESAVKARRKIKEMIDLFE